MFAKGIGKEGEVCIKVSESGEGEVELNHTFVVLKGPPKLFNFFSFKEGAFKAEDTTGFFVVEEGGAEELELECSLLGIAFDGNKFEGDEFFELGSGCCAKSPSVR